MNIRELINQLLEETRDLDQEVCIETKHGIMIEIWKVNQARKGNYSILSLEPTEDIFSEEEAREDFGS